MSLTYARQYVPPKQPSQSMDIFQLTEKVEQMQATIKQLNLMLLVEKANREENEKLINRLFELV